MTKWIYRLTKVFVIAAMGTMELLVLLQVASRRLGIAGLVWTSELTTYVLVWMIFVGCSIAMHDNELMSVQAVFSRLGPRTRTVLAILNHLILIAFFVFCIAYNSQILEINRTHLSPVMQIPRWWVHVALTISFAVMVWYSAVKIVSTLRSLRAPRTNAAAGRPQE